jgi:diguanylate cyclase (GGDEF)-like protein/PAS domain S-box-containing protein
MTREQILEHLKTIPGLSHYNLYQTLAETARDIIFIVNTGYYVEYVNSCGALAVGVPKEQIIGKNLKDIFPPAIYEKLKSNLLRIITTGEPLSTEEMVVLQGKERYLGTNCVPIKDDSGLVTAVIGISRDITGQKEANVQLELQRQQLLSIFDSMDEPVYITDPSTYEILYVNKALFSSLSTNYEFGSVVGRHCYKVFQNAQAPCSFCTNNKIFGENIGKTHIWEVQNQANCNWYHCVDRAILWPDGRLVRCEIAIDITERKIAEEALQESEEKYRHIVETSRDGIGLSQDGRILYANEAFCTMFGYTKDELIGDSLLKVVAPTGRSLIKQRYQMGMEGEDVPYMYTFEGLKKDGTSLFIEVSSGRIFSYKNKPTVLAVLRDISEQEKTKQALSEQETFLSSIFTSIQDGISILDKDMNIVQVNPTMEKWYAHAVPLVGKKCYEAYHGRKERCYICPSYQAFLTGKSSREIVPKIDKDGQVAGWLNLFSFPLFNIKTKELEGVIEYVRDITEQKNAEEALQESEEKYRNLVEHMPKAATYVASLDDLSTTLYVSPQIETIWGFSPEECLRDHVLWENKIHPDDKERTIQALMRCHATLEPYNAEYRLFKKNEGVVWIHDSASVVRDHNGKPLCLHGVMFDITELKNAEEELRHRLEFERLVSLLTTGFINLAPQEIDSGVSNALRAIGEFAGIDRSYIFLLSKDKTKVDNTHEWCAPGIEADISRCKGLTVKNFSWFAEKMNNKEAVYVADVDHLPSEAMPEKLLLKGGAVKSFICVPLVCADEVMGFLGFDSVKERKEWKKEIIDLLKITAGMFSNALVRKEKDNAFIRLNEDMVRSNEKLKELSLRDPHTNLYNHRYLQEVIEAEFHRARRYVHPFSAIMLDVDYFKSINDVYGHTFGDLVLKQFSKQLKKMVRRYDTVIRFGGEEFVIISPNADRQTALMLAQRILDAITLYNFGNDKHIVKLKLSIAVTSYPEDQAVKGMDLIQVADKILNKIKESGGNNVCSALDIKSAGKDGLLGEESNDAKFLKKKIERLNRRASQSLTEAIFAFAKTIEVKDHYTGEHVESTVRYATELAKALRLSPEEIEHIRQAAVLHDLGKVGISEEILHKKSKLTPKEYKEIKKHPQLAVDIIRSIHFLRPIIPLVLYHHERWDGKGYPGGLKGEEIPMGARIVAIADVFQALSSDRPYRKAYSSTEALRIIKEEAGRQFDPQIVQSFLRVMHDTN